MAVSCSPFEGIDLTEEKEAIFNLLTNEGQEHLFQKWKSGVDDSEKLRLIDQCAGLHKNYPGGLSGYLKNARGFLEASSAGVNTFDGWMPSVPSGTNLEFGGEEFKKMEEVGASVLHGCGFVLVAGGLGERLGYGGIKVALPIDLITNRCFLRHYCESILALQKYASIKENKSCFLPLAIMTSGDTHDKTVELLQRNNNFGLAEGQITFIKQEKVPALGNNQCHFVLQNNDPYQIQTKPHGHGDVHSLMHNHGVAQKWLEQYGTRWTLFFQDTNPAVFRTFLSTLGVSVNQNYAMNTITIPRKPGEPVGGIACLKHEDGRQMTVNVEYNQLGPLLENSEGWDGDVADETGFSSFPGNTNNFIVKHDLYVKILKSTNGMVPEFVNPKYTDETKTIMKKPTRLESLMQDYAKSLSEGNHPVGITCHPKWLAKWAVKNNITDAKKKYEKTGVAESASGGEHGIFYQNRQILRAAGLNLEEIEGVAYTDIPVPDGAKVVLHPSFFVTFEQLCSKLTNVSFTSTSFIILEGDVNLENINVDGFVHFKGSQTVRDIDVKNEGAIYQPIDVNDTNIEEKFRIRGYVMVEKEKKIVDTNESN